MNVLTEYRVHPDNVDEQVAALKLFAEQLKALNNPDIKFTAYQLHDKVSFRHVMYLKDDATAALLVAQDFYKTLGDATLARAVEAPMFSPMDMVATFKI